MFLHRNQSSQLRLLQNDVINRFSNHQMYPVVRPLKSKCEFTSIEFEVRVVVEWSIKGCNSYELKAWRQMNIANASEPEIPDFRSNFFCDTQHQFS